MAVLLLHQLQGGRLHMVRIRSVSFRPRADRSPYIPLRQLKQDGEPHSPAILFWQWCTEAVWK
jgi:hypothetical protein